MKKFNNENLAEKEYENVFHCDGCEKWASIDDHACNSENCEIHNGTGGNYCDDCCPHE